MLSNLLSNSLARINSKLNYLLNQMSKICLELFFESISVEKFIVTGWYRPFLQFSFADYTTMFIHPRPEDLWFDGGCMRMGGSGKSCEFTENKNSVCLPLSLTVGAELPDGSRVTLASGTIDCSQFYADESSCRHEKINFTKIEVELENNIQCIFHIRFLRGRKPVTTSIAKAVPRTVFKQPVRCRDPPPTVSQKIVTEDYVILPHRPKKEIAEMAYPDPISSEESVDVVKRVTGRFKSRPPLLSAIEILEKKGSK